MEEKDACFYVAFYANNDRSVTLIIGERGGEERHVTFTVEEAEQFIKDFGKAKKQAEAISAVH